MGREALDGYCECCFHQCIVFESDKFIMLIPHNQEFEVANLSL